MTARTARFGLEEAAMSLAKTVSAKVLDFWYAGKYATPAERNKGALMKMWWQGDAALDAQVRSPLT